MCKENRDSLLSVILIGLMFALGTGFGYWAGYVNGKADARFIEFSICD